MRKKTKIHIGTWLLVCLILCFCGCGAKNNGAKDNGAQADAKKQGRTYRVCADGTVSEAELDEMVRLLGKRAEVYSAKAEVEKSGQNIRIYIPNLKAEDEDAIYGAVTSRGELQILENYGEPDERIVITNGDVSHAEAETYSDENGVQYIINILYTEEGTKKFAEATKANIGKKLTILYDGELVCAPTVTAEITDGRAVINNFDNAEDAKLAALAMQDGILPYALSEETL